MVEDCFSNFVNIESFQRVYFWRFWSSVKFIWPMLWFTKELNTYVWVAYGSNDLCRLKRSTALSWIPPKVTMLHGSKWRKFFRQILPWRVSIRKYLDQIVHRCWSFVAECYSRCWELDNVPLFLKKVFHSESRDAILLREEGCNTLGVCHSLSSGFDLKYDRLSGDDDVKVNLWRWA
jgi:hypothetical protein